jgi:cell division protein FtsX
MQDIFIKNSAEIERKDNKKSNLIEKVKDAKDIKGIELETKNNSAKQLTKKSEEKLTISSKKQ